MPTYNLPFQDKISQSSSSTTTYRLNTSQFGDGYSQRTPDGINYQTKTWQIVYDNITLADLTTLQTWLDTVGDGRFFYWTPIGYSVSLKWILASDVRVSPRSGNIYSAGFTIKQVFDLS